MRADEGAIALVWDNFGPMHLDRCEAVRSRFAGKRRVVGIEICGNSDVYAWQSPSGDALEKITLFPDRKPDELGVFARARALVSACLTAQATDVFMCHYDHPATLMASSVLRLSGRRLYAMGCSKFDDYERRLKRELVKSVFYLPYTGGISSGRRARDYMRFLGLPADRVKTEYNTLSIDRIRRMAGVPPAPDGTPFEERHFTIVARFVPKKNIATALEAYSLYVKVTREKPRPLHLCGSGPLEGDLRAKVTELGLTDLVVFRGFLQTQDVARVLGQSLALVLPSIEEQFGNVVIEAQAMGLPVVLSDNCGARDLLVRSGTNGFVVEPDNPEGLAYFMSILGRDSSVWRVMCLEARAAARKGDVAQFAAGVCELVVA